MNARTVIGPPGTGKTTHLSEKVREAVARFGARSVLIASLTRAAAAEVAGRDLPIDKDRIGTLHAHAWRALGRPPIAETKENLPKWNEAFPEYKLVKTKGSTDAFADDGGEMVSRGDQLFERYNCLRARLVPREAWPLSVQVFASRWEDWKSECGLVDFEDMIVRAHEETTDAPGSPNIIYGDEAQDWSASEMQLVLRWAEAANAIVLVADPDQTIYSWRGADPNLFIKLCHSDKDRRVLAQSYRVPRAVHALAIRWIARVTDRVEAEYHPRDAEGSIIHSQGSYRSVRPILADLRTMLGEGKRCMFLTSCGYMLQTIISSLREEGIPYHNPFRTHGKGGDWNPLRRSSRLRDYLATDKGRLWTWGELARWTGALAAKGLIKHGMKSAIEVKGKIEPRTRSTPEEIEDLFEPDACEVGNLEWFESRLLKKGGGTIRYQIEVAKRHGKEALTTTPQVVVGTIHSVKGGEADVVYLFPDLSRQGMEHWLRRGSEGYGAIVRLFYVGMTRARERLVICQPASPFSVRISA